MCWSVVPVAPRHSDITLACLSAVFTSSRTSVGCTGSVGFTGSMGCTGSVCTLGESTTPDTSAISYGTTA